MLCYDLLYKIYILNQKFLNAKGVKRYGKVEICFSTKSIKPSFYFIASSRKPKYSFIYKSKTKLLMKVSTSGL